jgi:hypothetical protein
MKRPPNKFLPNQKIGELMANISFDVIHLCQTIVQCPKTTQMQCYAINSPIFWLGRNLFGGRFIRFMSGPKYESDILTGSSTPNRFLFVSLAVIQAIHIAMVFCKESMSVPFASNPGN